MKKILLLLTVILMSCTTLLQAQVCNKPTINSFSPITGFIGSVVTINGSNFDPIPANNQVFFGATQAQVISASFGVLEVRVPVGATYGPITVRNACGLVGASPLSFNGIFCGTSINSTTYSTVSYSANVSGGYQMISQDIDLDGKPDLLVCGFTANRVSVMRNQSNPGSFNFAPKFDLVFQGATRCISTGDFDGDGKIDIAVVDNGINGIRIYRNTSVPGTLSFATPVDIPASSSYQLATGDINGDGKMDLVYGSGPNIGALRNTSTTGSISFATAQIFSNTFYLTGVAIADVDGDGRPDVGTSCPSDNSVTALRNTTVPGSTTFSFASAVSFPTNSSYPYRLFLGDFDKDNKIDFVTNNHNGGTTSVFRNTSVPGTISFAPTVNLTSTNANYRLGVGDADGDGNVDLVTKSSGVSVFSVYKNTSSGQGNISFAPRVDYPGQAEVSGILIGDLDGDYVPDIATSGISFNTLRVHRNNSTVVDNTAPIASCKNITVALSPTGTVTITPQMVDNGSSDACGIQSLALSKTNFTCADIGANNVTLTVTDRAGNVSTCTAVVTVAPAAVIIAGQSTVCQGQTVTMSANLGDSYQWQKDGVDINGAASQTYVATVTGNYSVTVTNAGGCSGTSSPVTVTVSPAPVVTTTPSGNATLCNGSLVITASAGSVYQWSNGATTQAITVTQAGSYSVTVTNQFGCTNTSAPVVVGATDNVPPVAKCKNISVAINANGTASITAASINDGSFDNCGAVTLSISGQTSYSCADAGNTFNVVLTATDAQGNQSSCTATVSVIDPNSYCNQPPVAVCKPLTVSANANCQGIAVAADFNNGSSDPNGDALTYSVLPAGPYAKGVTNVVLTVTDSKGASSTCSTTITVVDDLAPVVTAPANVTVNTDAGVCIATNVSLGTPVVSDNCTGWTVTNNAPTQFEKGVTNVTWTVTDASGNVTTAVQTVTVKDVTPPVIICQPNVAVNNDPNKCGAVVNYAVNATDNCVGPSGSLTFAYTGSIINWTVPAGVTKINIKALGGRGGNSINGFGGGGNGGKGASIQGDFTVVPGQVLQILVAGHGEDAINSTNVLNTGGGGGSFVWNSTTGNTLMLAAGGGTGLGTCNSQQAKPGLATLGGSGNGGLGGNFNCGINNGGGGGAGWLSNGGGTVANPGLGGKSPLNGGNGGAGGIGGNGYFGTAGGFGGGAGGGGNCGGPGGGGGYSGGNGGDNTLCGAGTQPVVGGTSYNQGTNQVNITGVNDGHGQVIISYQGSSATITQTAGLPSGSLFPVGTTTNTFVATDESGNTSTCSFDVVVTDVQKPVISNLPTNISVSNDASVCGAKVNWTAPTATDNCPGVTISSTHAPGSLFPVGNTTVTYTATDASGNQVSGSFTVTVNDTEKPTIAAPAAIQVSNDEGQCIATPSLGNASTGDNCGVQSVVNNAPVTFPVGTTTVIWTVTDIHGNVSTATQTVTVNDTEKPVIACLTNQVFCANVGGNNNYNIPVLVQSDNCGIASTSYVVSGATSRSGNGTNASGVFLIGTSTVTYTVTDVHGNVSNCSFTVKINPLPVPTAQAASPNVFCKEFTLTGFGNQNGPFAYNWSLNGNTVGSTQVLTLGLTNPDGLYKLFITDANGCTSEFPATYQYNKQNLTNSYTILASKEVKLGAYNEVQTGSVGVMSSKGEAEFKKYSKVNGAGSFVKAPEIDKDKGVTILSQIIGVATVSLPTMQYNTSVTKYLPSNTVGANTTVTLNGNFKDLNIRKGANVTLNGTIFGSIKVEEGASIRFTSAVVNIEELRVDKGSKTTMSYVRFTQPTSVRVSKNVSIGNDVIVNPDYHSITFYLGDTKCDEEKFYVKGDDTKIVANIYIPNGKLKIRGGNGNDDDDDRCDHKAHSSKSCKHNNNKHGHKDCNHNSHSEKDCDDNVQMVGLFIAEEVESEGKNVIWNNFSCSAQVPVVTITNTNTNATLTAETVKQPDTQSATQLQVTVMPNPSASVFTIKLQSKYDAPVQMRITDATGRAVESKANLGANSTVQVGASFMSGTYYAEFTQGNQRKVVQLIKVR
ncbi:HYR domain-containing protein [Sediminibacterium sp.]|uniref:HYR domain-containing protein n=1 Tax=Sediminibacterium sp. TaxID=1917865 RepID=UPI003F6F2F11